MTTDDELRRLDEAVVASLAAQPGDAVLVVGCGVGRLALATAKVVGADGHVLGVDHRPRLIADARRRGASIPQARLIAAEPGHLGLASGSFDRALIDAGTADLDDPAAAIVAVVATLRPGGVVVHIAPDWATLTLNVRDIALSHRVTRAIGGAGHSPLGGDVGTQLAALGIAVSSQTQRSVSAHTWCDLVLISELPARIGRAVADGAFDLDDADMLLADLEAAEAAGKVLATLTTTIVTGRRL